MNETMERIWSPYQQAIFEFIESSRGSLLVEAVAGCLSGDTVLGINRGGKSYQGTISYLTEMMNGGTRSGKQFAAHIPTTVRSLAPDNGVIRLANVASAVYSGKKETYTVRTKSGHTIRATRDHKFLTTHRCEDHPQGWMPLSSLTIGISLLVDGGKGGTEEFSKPYYEYAYRMDHHPFASVTHNHGVAYYRVPVHRLIVEAAINGAEYEEFVGRVQAGQTGGLEFLDPETQEVHHKDENTRNNALGNLVVLTPKKHRELHAATNWVNVQAHVVPSEIESIVFWGEEDTYDLTMQDETCPNFLANGIVVHNSGKTTTIVEAIRHVPSNQSVAFLAFNKSIAEELKRRVTQPNAKCMTLHAAGFNAWRQFLSWDAGNLEVDSRKTSKMIDALADRDEIDKEMIYTLGGEMGKLIGVAKAAGIAPKGVGFDSLLGLASDDLEVWEELVEFYGLDEDKWDEDSINIARRVLAESIAQARNVIDFDDMLYMPVISGATFEKFDVVFLDEAQDVSGIQVEMVDRMRNTRTRIISVGDRHQAIYGFRGALSNSMDNIKERFDAEELPLSVSYRCPKLVVEHAQSWVPQIESFEGAAAGEVSYPESWKVKDFHAGDAVLCRVSRPTVELAFRLIRSKIPAKVLGRDIGQGLIKLVDKMKALDLVDLDQKLTQYRAREAKKSSMTLEKLAALDDKIDTVRVFMDEQGIEDGTLGPSTSGGFGISNLKASIEALFGESADGARMVTLSTVHKAKGLEWSRVFILDADLYMPSRWARQPWQRQQEANLQYVAATRAKQELVYVSSLGMVEER